MSTNLSSMNKRDMIITYVKKEAEKGHYPTYDFLATKFKTNLRNHFPME